MHSECKLERRLELELWPWRTPVRVATESTRPVVIAEPLEKGSAPPPSALGGGADATASGWRAAWRADAGRRAGWTARYQINSTR